jgi:hypothetical protein
LFRPNNPGAHRNGPALAGDSGQKAKNAIRRKTLRNPDQRLRNAATLRTSGLTARSRGQFTSG